MADVKIPKTISTDAFLNQIRAGMHDAVVELMRSGSSNPGADFFNAIRAGIREAVKAVAREREAATGRQEAQPSAPVGVETGPPHGDPSSGGVQP